MNEIQKELAAATRQKDRAVEAFTLNPGSQELGDRLTAAFARFAQARAAAGGLPPPPPRVPRCTDPHPRHKIEAEMHLKTAEQYRADLVKALAMVEEARAAVKHMQDRADSYTPAEIANAKKRIVQAEAVAKYHQRGLDRATSAAAKSLALAEGKPRPPKPTPAEIDRDAHAKRVRRWQRTEQRLAHVETVWMNRLEDAAEALDTRSTDKAARWHDRCTRMLHQATARLAAYRRDHGLATAPPTPDPLEKDENGEYIL